MTFVSGTSAEPKSAPVASRKRVRPGPTTTWPYTITPTAWAIAKVAGVIHILSANDRRTDGPEAGGSFAATNV